jgi:phage I-like protein
MAQAGAGAPEWVHLVPAGTFKGLDGRGPYKLADAEAVIKASMADGKLPIDENHATDHAMKSGIPSPARGWIVELEARADGIHGRVEWTDTGKQMMAEGAYRGISPVFVHDKAGVVLRVLRAALTNTPNLADLEKLHSQRETGMDLVQLRKTLGLAENADETAIAAAITANAQAVATHTQQLSSIATAAGLATNLAPDALVTALQARQTAASDADKLAGQVVSLQTQLSTLEAERKTERATSFVEAAIKAGKPITPLRDHYIARHIADAAAVEKEINALHSINAGGVTLNAQGEPDGDEPTASEKMVASKMGVDVKGLVAQRKKRADGASDGRAA